MFEDLKGKRLLIIGSSAMESLIVEEAQSLGVYVIAADGKPLSAETPAKLAADEFWTVDYSDLGEMTKHCRAGGVDGVMAGYSENRALWACRLADALGLPFYATEEQILITRNKRSFKDACREYGVKTPWFCCIRKNDSPETRKKILEQIPLPVVVKPVDYAGKKGVSVCETPEALLTAVERALSYSFCGEAIIEELIRGTEFAARYTIGDGEAVLSILKEKYLFEEYPEARINHLDLAPSPELPRFLKETDGPLRSFLRGFGVRNGVVNFQGIYNEKGFWIFETGFRLGGGNDFYLMEKLNGINYMKMMISYALTGSMGDDVRKNDPFFSEYAACLFAYAHGGTVGRVGYYGDAPVSGCREELQGEKKTGKAPSFLPEESGVIRVLQLKQAGMTIKEDMSNSQRAFSVYLTAPTMEELKKRIEDVSGTLEIRDTEGKDLMFQRFDTGRLSAFDRMRPAGRPEEKIL